MDFAFTGTTYSRLAEEEVRTHLLATHLDDFYEVEEIVTEPPAGNFVCVARCGLSGEWLGPPNHHSFNARVQEMLRTRFADMNEETYRSRIEMVRTPEAVNQWREQCRKKTVYRRKQAASVPETGDRSPEQASAAPPAAVLFFVLPGGVPAPGSGTAT